MKSAITMRVAKWRMKNLPPSLRRSVTFDNGKEFAEHAILSDGLGLEVYFADPYASWQRGTNENTNGLLRQFFPKGTDFTRIGHRGGTRGTMNQRTSPQTTRLSNPGRNPRTKTLPQLILDTTSAKIRAIRGKNSAVLVVSLW